MQLRYQHFGQTIKEYKIWILIAEDITVELRTLACVSGVAVMEAYWGAPWHMHTNVPNFKLAKFSDDSTRISFIAPIPGENGKTTQAEPA